MQGHFPSRCHSGLNYNVNWQTCFVGDVFLNSDVRHGHEFLDVGSDCQIRGIKRMKPKRPIETLILTLRGQKVILDADLASIYYVPTFRFNEAFKRNRERFPEDFAFQLTTEEFAALRVANSSQPIENQVSNPNRSQFVTSPRKHRGAAYRPWAFTEHGALMAANILRSERAVEMSVFVIRAFVRAREQLAANAAILKRLAEIITVGWRCAPPWQSSSFALPFLTTAP